MKSENAHMAMLASMQRVRDNDVPDMSDDFSDWWESVTDDEKLEWCDEFVADKTGPLAEFIEWDEMMGGCHWVYLDPFKVNAKKEWWARDKDGNFFTRKRNRKTLYRMEIADLQAFRAAAEYKRRYMNDASDIDALDNLIAHCVREVMLEAIEDNADIVYSAYCRRMED